MIISDSGISTFLPPFAFNLTNLHQTLVTCKVLWEILNQVKTFPILKKLTNLVKRHKYTNHHKIREKEISPIKVIK